jgi:hypothetical protein
MGHFVKYAVQRAIAAWESGGFPSEIFHPKNSALAAGK